MKVLPSFAVGMLKLTLSGGDIQGQMDLFVPCKVAEHKNKKLSPIIYRYLGHILYANLKKEPVVKHLLLLSSYWEQTDSIRLVLENDACDLEEAFPEYKYKQKYYKCFVRRFFERN